ncbi:hypothetical protein C1645_818128 [Glomus cerebriforme]|uniref:Uncharacterized protein n=1 Tax=Glomus cerebriforme TaxID=658196 RepID=A0A397T7Y8_9GLOM|nr:hypothetical protein C1645_818128 [Glomus cerebriforme]
MIDRSISTVTISPKQKFVLNLDSLENSSQKSDMHNKSVAKNKCQYIEIDYNQGLDDTKKSPSSKMSQKPVFITLSDENEKDKKKNGDPIVSKFQQSELNPVLMENAYHNPEESEKEADKGGENKIVI